VTLGDCGLSPAGQLHVPPRAAVWPPSRMFRLNATATPSSFACASTSSRQAAASPLVTHQLYWFRT